MSARRDELAAGLAATQERITAACGEAGRDPGEVSLVVVTKTYPASDVALLTELGVTDVGENRHPEAGRKLDELDALGVTRPRAHFVGGLQTNKANAVTRYADVVQSIDRPRLVTALARGAELAERSVGCLIQVDFDTHDPGRAGVPTDGVDALADLVAEQSTLRLDGVMTVAPLGAEPRAVFERLVEISQRLVARHPGATVISAGMSGDLEAAVAAGATMVRVGSAILGSRDARGVSGP